MQNQGAGNFRAGRPLRAQAQVPSQPAGHGPGRPESRVGSGAQSMWVCEATTSGCDERAPLSRAARACPREGPQAGQGTGDMESCNTDHCALGQVPKAGLWPLHVHPGLHSSWGPEAGLAGGGRSLISRTLSQTGLDPTQGLFAKFPEAGTATWREGDGTSQDGLSGKC